MIAGLDEFATPFGKDFGLSTEQLVFGCDITDGTVKPLMVVVSHKLSHQATGILQREWGARPDTIAFDGLVPAFELAVTLGIARRGADVAHATQPDEFLEVLGHKLRAIV